MVSLATDIFAHSPAESYDRVSLFALYVRTKSIEYASRCTVGETTVPSTGEGNDASERVIGCLANKASLK